MGNAETLEVVVSWAQARCATGDASILHLFFSEGEAETRKAKEICTPCVLRHSCFQAAVSRQEPWGVWGGELFHRGAPIMRKPTRGRPRKDPVPSPVTDELGSVVA